MNSSREKNEAGPPRVHSDGLDSESGTVDTLLGDI